MSDFRCRSCGLDINICVCNNYKTVHENESQLNSLFPKLETRTSIIAEFKNKILELERYDEWIEKHEDGDYIKIEDILNLF